IGASTAAANQNGSQIIELSVSGVVNALAYHDRAENVFQGHVALIKHLLDSERYPDAVPSSRCPNSPIPGMDEAFYAEDVEPQELVRLITNEISPFGQR